MVQLDDFKKFDFRHITTSEFFELEKMIVQLLMERDDLRKENKDLEKQLSDHICLEVYGL